MTELRQRTGTSSWYRSTTPEFPSREDTVLGDVLARRVAETPDRTFAVFQDGESWTYRGLAERVWGLATAFADELGAVQGEVIAAWLPNGPVALVSWFAANAAGCAYAPLNTAYRGAILETALNLTQARTLVAHADLVDRLVGLDLRYLENVVVVDGAGATGPGTTARQHDFDDLAARRATAPPPLRRSIEPWDDMTVLLTSGTTGVSKAVRRSYLQYTLYTETTFRHVGATADDRFYVCAPMFHGGGDTPVYSMLQLGASIAITEGFSASGFWDDVRRFDCTIAWIHSAMSLFLAKQAPRDDDLDNPLRLAMLAPLFPGFDEFAARFGFHVYTVMGMTELPCVFSWLDPTDHRSVGVPADPGYEVRIVDANDLPVERGTQGELVLRHRLPWAITAGYLNNPAATASAWRNGWFHTGDVFVQDEAGRYCLVDRLKDSIRRRGENVSAAEVETELLAHEHVIEAAVIAVDAEIEDDILAYVVARPDVELTPEALVEHLVSRLPYFAIPRYIQFADSLPHSVALRVDKPALRAKGLPAGAWDREASDVVVRRERFSTP